MSRPSDPRAVPRWFVLAPVAVLVLALAGSAAAADPASPAKIVVEIEAGPVWQTVNDVESPNDGTATRFSLVDVAGNGPWSTGRTYVTWVAAPRHALRLLVAPLSITAASTLADSIRFEGTTFAAGSRTEAAYEFHSYRVTYRYLLREHPRWSVWVGLTAKIRDARIGLRQEGREAEKANVGFVPLLHLGAAIRLGDAWRAVLDVDAIAGGPGRAEDVAITLAYAANDRVSLKFGYRTVEGGADVEEVYSFGWLHYLVLGGSLAF